MSEEPRWWVGINDRPHGPWTAAEIATALSEKRIDTTTLACAVGGDRWQPIKDIPEIAPQPPKPPATAVVKSRTPANAPEVNPYSPPASSVTATLPSWEWPSMKALVTKYCLYAMPIYQGLGLLLLFIVGTGSEEGLPDYWMKLIITLLQFPVRIALCILFLVAGIYLRKDDVRAVSWTRWSICVGFGLIACAFLVAISCGPYIEALTPPELQTPAPWTDGLILFLGFLMLAWEVWILIWLHLQRENLFASPPPEKN